MHPIISENQHAISDICRRYGIRRLEVFGSAARVSDFEPVRSDVDMLVEFDPDSRPGLDSYFGAKAELEELFGCSVDLLEAASVTNPYLKAGIDESRETVYAA